MSVAAPALNYTFRPAVRENVGLLVGLAGPSGSGKTYTAMRLAKGMAGDKPFAVIDTEAGRAKHYADTFRFDHCDMHAPFSPDAYAAAIQAADRAGYTVIVVDSFSHEHAGEGGLLDWHEHEYQRLGNRDAVKMTAWIKPKMAHRAMVSKLLQVRAHLILCLRAEEKVDIVKDAQGKVQIVPKQTLAGYHGWVPICEKNLPFELTASFLLLPDKPGVPRPIKLAEQLRPMFPLDKPITEESGARIAAWARGGVVEKDVPQETAVAAEKPVEPESAAMLLTRIKAGFTKLAMKEDRQREFWTKHCQGAAFLSEQTDVALLGDLLADLRAQAKTAAK